VLGVHRDAGPKEIKKAYLGFVKRYHPDKLVGKDKKLIHSAQEELRRKNRARSILMDPQKRTLVDKMVRENEGGRIRDLSIKSMDELKNLGRK
jgi:curved DNA-binding protein CbpA